MRIDKKVFWRKRRDSNPRYGCYRITDFESVAFDHSATFPLFDWSFERVWDYISPFVWSQSLLLHNVFRLPEKNRLILDGFFGFQAA